MWEQGLQGEGEWNPQAEGGVPMSRDSSSTVTGGGAARRAQVQTGIRRWEDEGMSCVMRSVFQCHARSGLQMTVTVQGGLRRVGTRLSSRGVAEGRAKCS